MHRDSSTPGTHESIPIRKGIVALSGYGVQVSVEHGRLCLSDGVASARRLSRFSKATSGIRRLVILGHSGVVTLEALRWLRDIKAAVVQIDADGQVVLASSPPTDGLTRLRRAQVEAVSGVVGIGVVRKLLFDKLTGQADVAQGIGNATASEKIRALAAEIGDCDEWSRMEPIESQAAGLYWRAWADVPVQFARRDARRVPEEWCVFGSRLSPLSGSARNAANPANALLNYLYAILEAETRIAVLTVGLDPGLGLLHTDRRNRDSLACDVMEPVRPQVDAWLLDFLAGNHFARGDFFERADGTVRLSSRVTRLLAETSPTWARAVAPVAEWVTAELLKGSGRQQGRRLDVPLPTPLTQGNRSAGRSAYRQRHGAPSARSGMDTPRSCPECGKVIQGKERKFCSDQCFEAYKREVDIPRLTQAGPAKLAALRSTGADPAHGGGAGRKRGISNARRAAERAEWEKQGLDLEEEKERFARDILPRLRDLSIMDIVKATGFSPRYASLVKRGLYVPHPVHNEALARLLGAADSQSS